MLKGRCALVTGSAGGLGLAIAAGLARAGCNIMLSGLDPASEVAAQRLQLQQECGVAVGYCREDLSEEAGVARLIDATREAFGDIHVLVNNAVVRHFAPIHEFPVDRWNAALAVNLSAAFHSIRLTLPGMRSAGFGRIINMSSVYGFFGIANRIDYVTTKTALLGMTRVVALETLNDGITCNAICPGTVQTPSIEGRIQTMMEDDNVGREEAVERFLSQRQPTRRFIASEDVAELVVFLCGMAARDITGSSFPIDAGWLAC